MVGGTTKASFERLSKLMTTKHNFQNYRAAAQAAKRPAVPYIGMTTGLRRSRFLS